jgi:hypothetical protein
LFSCVIVIERVIFSFSYFLSPIFILFQYIHFFILERKMVVWIFLHAEPHKSHHNIRSNHMSFLTEFLHQEEASVREATSELFG